MKIQPIFFAFALLLSLSGCKKIDDAIFPLAGNWKPAADRTTRIQYTSGGQTLEVV